ncbi:TonB-dependent receptor [Brumicola pallidula]|uniref:TonB-dependent receptor n=1 Tax=Brumicola pallidula DSM 14239 = ACAM 615 TaxID=1121922 RepID=K6ZKF4_9ALTE|nr:TonB-dependent receptor [Glaciecola pallidula]GAC30792.1 TonB-dependent receptor [Glaciecola pallidula DSM 14239 = ACAM 615]
MNKTLLTFGKRTSVAIAVAGALLSSNQVIAQQESASDPVEVILVSGIRSSLKASMQDKKSSNLVSDGIKAEDLGKFPDLNVAESLQRITGVSIDRSGGEGQAVTIRGFGPQFNTVLVNGRQIATDSAGREFNFDVLASDQIVGADVYKSTSATMQEGGIGGTISLITAKPFDYEGFKAVASVKGMYESLSEKTSPSVSALVSNTFNDDTMGVLLAVSHQKRDIQINQISTAGWRGGQTIQNNRDGVLFSNAYIPRNWDQIVDNQERTRTNASLVFQYAPSDDITISLDGFVSKFEVDSVVTDLASWFEPDRVGSATIDPATGTLLTFSQDIGLDAQGSGDPASDFVSTTRNSRDVTNDGFGLNVEWDINDSLKAEFDLSTSSAENDRAGKDRFNVVGIINSYEFDGTGSVPTVQHDGFGGGSLPDASLSRLHYNEKGNVRTEQDEITEFKADFTYRPDSDVLDSAKFGIYRQEREKNSFQIFGGQCAFCGYDTPAPNDVINFRPFTANNFFPGLIDTFYTYDGDAMVDYLASTGNPIVPTLQNNRYTINEDITSLYMDFTFIYDIGDMPLSVNVGARYAQTDIAVSAVQSFLSDVIPTTDATLFQNVFGPATDILQGGSYANLLPSVNTKLQVTDEMIVRFSVYDSLTRPTMNQLSPATTFNEPRRQNLTASGGNPTLKPFQSDNWDISFEYYYGDANLFTFAFFNKEVDNFITRLTGPETYTLNDRLTTPNNRCSVTNTALCSSDATAGADELNGLTELYTVTRPQNGDAATVTGYEIGLTHLFDNGFGFQANATIVDSNVSLGSDTTQSFALEGLGDSQNLVVFYENDQIQARIAYNNREGFLRAIDNGFNGEPINTETFGQWDVSASYDIDETFTVFFEGINITEEELVQTGRFANQTYSIEDNGRRFALGVRAVF